MGFEPTNNGFAGHRVTTSPPVLLLQIVVSANVLKNESHQTGFSGGGITSQGNYEICETTSAPPPETARNNKSPCC